MWFRKKNKPASLSFTVSGDDIDIKVGFTGTDVKQLSYLLLKLKFKGSDVHEEILAIIKEQSSKEVFVNLKNHMLGVEAEAKNALQMWMSSEVVKDSGPLISPSHVFPVQQDKVK